MKARSCRLYPGVDVTQGYALRVLSIYRRKTWRIPLVCIADIARGDGSFSGNANIRSYSADQRSKRVVKWRYGWLVSESFGSRRTAKEACMLLGKWGICSSSEDEVDLFPIIILTNDFSRSMGERNETVYRSMEHITSHLPL